MNHLAGTTWPRRGPISPKPGNIGIFANDEVK